MNDNQSFWQTVFGRVIRWLLFLPVGFILVSILASLPPMALALAWGYKPEFSFLILIAAIFVVSIGGTIFCFWVGGVWMTPYLICRVIAPNNKVGSVIFGTLFCLYWVINILMSFLGDASWVLIIYQMVFVGIVIGGTVMAYQDS